MNYITLYNMIEEGHFSKVEEKLNELDLHSSNLLRALSLKKQNKFDDALEFIQSCMDSGEFYLPYVILRLTILANIRMFQSAFEDIENLEHEIKKEIDNPDIRYQIACSDYYNIIAIRHTLEGNAKESINVFNQAIEIERSIGSDIRLSVLLNNQAIQYYFNGDLLQSLQIHYEAKRIRENLDNQYYYAMSMMNICEIYELKGEYELAIEISLPITEIFAKGVPEHLAMLLGNLGRLYGKIGEDKTADQYFARAIKMRDEMKTDLLMAFTLFDYIYILLYYQRQDDAQAILEKLEGLHRKIPDNVNIASRAHLGRAIMLFNSKRMRDKYQAQDILEQVLELEGLDFIGQTYAMEYLIRILLLDYRNSQTVSIVSEINSLLGQYEQIAIEQKSLLMQTNGYLFKAQFALYSGQLEQSELILDRAYSLSEEKGLFLISLEISRIQDELIRTREMVSQLEGVTSFTLQGLSDFNPGIIKRFDMRADQTLQVFLIREDESIVRLIEDSNNKLVHILIPRISVERVVACDSRVYRQSYLDSNLIVLKDEFPMVGCIYQGDSHVAQVKLSAFDKMYRYYLASSKKESLDKGALETIKQFALELFKDTSIVDEKQDHIFSASEGLSERVLQNLNQYKLLLHPLRLLIMDVLFKNFTLARADLEMIIGGKRGTFASQLNKLISENLLYIENLFQGSNPRMYVYISEKGTRYYTDFKKIMSEII